MRQAVVRAGGVFECACYIAEIEQAGHKTDQHDGRAGREDVVQTHYHGLSAFGAFGDCGDSSQNSLHHDQKLKYEIITRNA